MNRRLKVVALVALGVFIGNFVGHALGFEMFVDTWRDWAVVSICIAYLVEG
jgi:hypothetical protein